MSNVFIGYFGNNVSKISPLPESSKSGPWRPTPIESAPVYNLEKVSEFAVFVTVKCDNEGDILPFEPPKGRHNKL